MTARRTKPNKILKGLREAIDHVRGKSAGVRESVIFCDGPNGPRILPASKMPSAKRPSLIVSGWACVPKRGLVSMADVYIFTGRDTARNYRKPNERVIRVIMREVRGR